MMQQLIEIDLHLCYESDHARAVDRKAVNALAASIEQIGLQSAIVVRVAQRTRSGKLTDVYEVIAGLHRVKAFRQLGRATIPALIQNVDGLTAQLILIDEN